MRTGNLCHHAGELIMKNILAPSILSCDFNILGEQVKLTEDMGVKYLHIDVMDGVFVPQISLGMPIIKSIRKKSKMIFDVHLMIVDPIRYIQEFANSGADIITFHLEACDNANDVIDEIHKCGCKAGISIKPNTPVAELEKYLDVVDMILIMSVEPGFGGQSYIKESTKKIIDTKKLIIDSGRDIDLEVDGGIKTDNVKMVLDAGANIIVAGSAVYSGDIGENIKSFLDLL